MSSYRQDVPTSFSEKVKAVDTSKPPPGKQSRKRAYGSLPYLSFKDDLRQDRIVRKIPVVGLEDSQSLKSEPEM